MLLDNYAPGAAVLIDAGTNQALGADDVRARAAWLQGLVGAGSLAFLLADNSLAAARDFHALVEAGIPVALLDASGDLATMLGLIALYGPELVLAPEGISEDLDACWPSQDHSRVAPGVWVSGRSRLAAHPDLAVLLTTSGSTGSPKFVRLSRANIGSNARQIAASMGITEADRGLTALPIHYSFGMSILTSHAIAGSPVVVTAASVLEPAIWEQVTKHRVTFFPGVPQTYQMLHRMRFATNAPGSLRALIQAGGRLDPSLAKEFAALMGARGGEFFVMYGQTEAAPRIACLPPASLASKLGSAGVALDGGSLEARDPDGRVLPPGETGQIHYTGPNVMMGYAESREDLALGDIQGDTLATGDLGYLDDQGFLFLTGRSKRIAKVAGLRISLDEVEAMVPDLSSAAVEAPAGTITIATDASEEDGSRKATARTLARRLRVPPKFIRVIHVPQIPLLASGKVDYRAVAAFAEEG